MGDTMRWAAAFAVLALASVAFGGNVEDADGKHFRAADESELYLPTDDKHFMDYVVALVDEFAPDRDDGHHFSAAHDEERSLERTERQDSKSLEQAKAALDKAHSAQKKQQALADKSHKEMVRADKKTDTTDKSKLKKEQAKLKKDEKVASKDRRAHEKLASKVIDNQAAVQKDELHVNDDTNELNRAKADVANARNAAGTGDQRKDDASSVDQEAHKDDQEANPTASERPHEDEELKKQEQKAEAGHANN